MRKLFLLVFTVTLAGQDRERPRGGFMRMSPVLSALDSDHDGSISEAERVAAPQALRKLDRNHDGQLTPDELRPNFGGPGRGGQPGGSPQEMTAMLMRFDQNGDGVLDKGEVPERMQGLFARGDKNQDGKLTQDELTALAQSQAPGGGRGPEGGREDRGGRGERGRGPGDPAVAAIDTDRDGTISAAEIDASAGALAKLDKNRDGKLGEDEVRPAFGPGGPGGPGRFGRDPSQMAGRMIEEWDQNGDGKISKTEMPERMRESFDAADLDRDGKLTRDELAKMMQQRFGEGRGRER